MARVSPFLKTLRRVPDDVILAAGSRDFNLDDADTCVCGWVVREAVARLDGKDADGVTVADYGWSVKSACMERFGGEWDEWNAIFMGVCDYRLPAIELAFTDRVLEAVERSL